MRRTRGSLSLVLAVLGFASPVMAQVAAERSDDQLRRPVVIPRATPKPVIGGYGLFEQEWMTAKDTFDAVFGTPTLRGVGVGGEVLNLWKHLFARASFSKAKDTGSRVFVFNGEPIALNIPLTLSLTTIELAGGWRVPLDRLRKYTAYGAGGVLFVNYHETSEFAGPGEDSREGFRGYTAFGGVDVAIWKWIYAGAEAQYRFVPDALGGGGVSKEFGESDLGGVAVRILVGVRK